MQRWFTRFIIISIIEYFVSFSILMYLYFSIKYLIAKEIMSYQIHLINIEPTIDTCWLFSF